MRLTRGTIIGLAVAVLVGVIVAIAFSGGTQHKRAAGMGTYGTTAAGSQAVADTGGTPVAAAGPTTTDPAKQIPVLDQFVSKDPFVPLPTPTPTPSPSSTGTGGGTGGGGTSAPTGAQIKFNSSTLNVQVNSKVPSSNPVFLITQITSSSVRFSLLHDDLFSDGTSFVDVKVGTHVSVKDQTSGSTYDLAVVKMIYGSGSSTSGTGLSTKGHSIEVTQINSKNGVPTATFVVDAVTYPDKSVGDVFSTGWGQIKVLSIDAAAGTVKVIHGDVTVVLHTGQAVAK